MLRGKHAGQEANGSLTKTHSMRLPSSMDEFAASMIGMFVIKFMTGIDDILWVSAARSWHAARI